MQTIANAIVNISGLLWGPPILIILALSSLFISIKIGFVQFTKFGYILKSTLGKSFVKSSSEEGTLSSFQALTSAVACTVGAGNIVGVPVAIMMGGPGSVFWMWLIALLGMSLKYGEIILAVKYRKKNEAGEYVGGPAKYMTDGLHMKWLAVIFAIGLMIEVAISSMTQANALSESTFASLHVPKIVTGIIVMVLAGIVIIGGVKRVGKFTEKLVPVMALLYIISSLVIVFMNIGMIPEVISSIFIDAFRPTAAVGGFAGASLALAIRWGCARGLYSNEAGLGTAPIAHAAAMTDHPARQGLWGITEVFIDTILICTCTAFVILTTGVWKSSEAAELGGGLTTLAFNQAFGPVGGIIITVCLVLFVFSTLVVLIWYGEKQAEYLFGEKMSKVYRFICVLLIPVGAVGGATFLWQFLDFSLVLILFPNIIAVLLLNKDIKEATHEFFHTPGKFYMEDTSKKN